MFIPATLWPVGTYKRTGSGRLITEYWQYTQIRKTLKLISILVACITSNTQKTWHVQRKSNRIRISIVSILENIIILKKFPSLVALNVVIWQLPVQPMMKISSKWQYFHFSETRVVLYPTEPTCTVHTTVHCSAHNRVNCRSIGSICVLFIYLSIYLLFIYSFIHSFTYLFIYLFIYLLIYLFSFPGILFYTHCVAGECDHVPAARCFMNIDNRNDDGTAFCK